MIKMICASIAFCGIASAEPMPSTSLMLAGNLSEYGQGVMERTVDYQLENGVISAENVEQVELFIAVYYCEHRDKFATVKYDGIDYLALIVDCANVAHDSTRRFFNSGIIAEVGYEFSQSVGLQENGRHAEVIIHE